MGTRSSGLTFRDIYLRPQQRAISRLPAESRADAVRSPTDTSGLIPQTGGPKLERIGQQLFRSLVRRTNPFSATARRRQQANPSLRTRVWIVLSDPQRKPLGNAQPWEVLCDPDGGPGAFLGCERTTAIIRTMHAQPRRHRLPPLEGALRILGVIATPSNRRTLDVAKEQRELEEALAGAKSMGLVELSWVTGPDTVEQLRRELRSSWHVLHFIGHGDFDDNNKLGFLAFENAAGQEHAIPANLLGGLLRNTGIRLVVLNSCRGAFAGRGGLLTSTAARLALDVPAVVAMQTEISDLAAVQFAGEFYERLLEGLRVEFAVAEARFDLAIRAPTSAIEWPAPVVYLSTTESILTLQTVKARPKTRGPRRTSRKRAGHVKRRTPSRVISAVPLTGGDMVEDDPQKGQWGGLPSNSNRSLEATVEAIDSSWYRIHLKVRTNRGKKPMTGPVHFHLHDSFPDPVRTVTAKGGEAALTLVAYGAFTVGVAADRGRTALELDLSELSSAPKRFRES
jgi:hypothetical protein